MGELKKVSYSFDENSDSFVINEYNYAKPFASFLPGIAGKYGIPLWVFYVNRGQCISSFGIGDKNNAILEFFPANNAYKMTPINGFRTFYRIKSPHSKAINEAFSVNNSNSSQKMSVRPESFSIEETVNSTLQFRVKYFIIPNAPFAGLVRTITVKNLSDQPIKLDLIDGMAQVIPYGVDMNTIKAMSYTAQAWMTVSNLEHDLAFFKLSMGSADTVEVSQIKNGNFALSFFHGENNGESTAKLKPIVDPQCIFGQDTSLRHPTRFNSLPVSELLNQPQITEGRIPCYFVGKEMKLGPNQAESIYTIIGQANDIDQIISHQKALTQIPYIQEKESQAKEVISSIMGDINLNSRDKLFDLYCKQTYLDNILRGGYPLTFNFSAHKNVYHLYIRKHGDQERDYNWFFLEPSFFSQGDGNYRDVNQNRRCEVSFHPEVGDFNIKTFMNLIQTDGFNPLVITGSTFIVKKKEKAKIFSMLDESSADNFGEKLFDLISKPFSLGALLQFISLNIKSIKYPTDEFLQKIISVSEQTINAVHGDGYWVDHWTYNLDLIEDFLSIFPDNEFSLFFEDKSYTFYDNFVFVRPREDKYVLVEGKVRQYHHLYRDPHKEELIKSRTDMPHKVRTKNGYGEVYYTNLFTKYFSLIINKFATLDPYGMGVEMESEKPGWYDAMNGLPGIFGSSMPETYELSRYCTFLIDLLRKMDIQKYRISIPIEVFDLMQQLKENLIKYRNSTDTARDHIYWDETARAREYFRKSVFYGLSGTEVQITKEELQKFAEMMLEKVQQGIKRSLELNSGHFPTYFYYEPVQFRKIIKDDGQVKLNEKNYPNVTVEKFQFKILPDFLEGFVRGMKIQQNTDSALKIHQYVLNSEIYDKKLKMFKLNAPLTEAPDEIGRAKGFTSGWLENGSIWMHMEYKYLLELLKAKLYKEFFTVFKEVLIPFQDPAIYGRPTIENSSFICSSAYPDENLHGNGFYARLSGSTAEFLHIWKLMMAGDKPFFMNEKKQLCLQLRPVLPDWMFTEDNTLEFRFLSVCDVFYYNPNRKNTYLNCCIEKYVLWGENEEKIVVDGAVITEPLSNRIREGKIKKMEVFLI